MATWSIPLDKLAEKTQQKIETVAKTAALELFNAVQIKSPVDTGRFRGNWQVSYQSPAGGQTNILDKTPVNQRSAHTTSVAEQVLRYPVGGVWYLVNNLPYSGELEYGYSQQAPAGMVRLSVKEFKNYVQQALR